MGGPPLVIAGLAAAQQRRGHEVTLVSSDRLDSLPVAQFLAERMSPVPLRMSLAPWPPLPFGPGVDAMTRRVRGSDLVHIHGLWAPIGLLAGRVCSRLGAPYVLSAHGMLHAAALNQKYWKKLIGLRLLGYGGLLRRAAALHLLNEEERDFPPSLAAPERVAVIPNGLFAEEFEVLPAPGTFRAKLPALGVAPFVLFLARLHPQKGLDRLAEAFARLARRRTDVHLVVVGPDQGARADFEARIGKFGLAERTHVVGPRYGRERLEAMRDAAVFCLPSRQEGFSMGITEALACGAPCVVTRNCNFPEVTSERLGRETEYDADSIADGLFAVFSDPAEARAMGERGRALVLSRYTWPRIVQEMDALYRACVH